MDRFKMSETTTAKGFRELATGFTAGIASVATVVGTVLGLLHEFGYIGTRAATAPSAVVVSAPPGSPPQIRSASLAPRQAAIAPARPVSPIPPFTALPRPQPDASGSPEIAAVNGAWRDSGMGFCHVIKQAAGNLVIVNFTPVGAVISVGGGKVNGRIIHLHMNRLNPRAANAELHLSNDGKKLLGTIHREDGDHPVAWHRVGPACG